MSEPPHFLLADAAIGQRVVVVEPIDEEIRWWHFARRELNEGETLFTPNYLPAFGLRTVQGYPGQKPRYDSGEIVRVTQMPTKTMVIDASHVNHEWTEAHAGLMIVDSNSWIGIYVRSKLVLSMADYEDSGLLEKLAKAIDDELLISRATAINDVFDRFPSDLTTLRLKDIRSC